MTFPQLALSFLAGTLTTLSPCVLPVLPFVTAASLRGDRRGPLALGAGLLFAFVLFTWTFALLGEIAGLDPSQLRTGAAILLILSSCLFLWPGLQDRLGALASRLTSRTDSVFRKVENHGLTGQVATGFLLGIVWTPCSGPSLGSAVGLAASSGSAAQALPLLLVFGLGAVLPFMAFAYGAQRSVLSLKAGSRAWIPRLKPVFGLLMLAFGIGILTGFDKRLESVLVGSLPDFWLNWTTKF